MLKYIKRIIKRQGVRVVRALMQYCQHMDYNHEYARRFWSPESPERVRAARAAAIIMARAAWRHLFPLHLAHTLLGPLPSVSLTCVRVGLARTRPALLRRRSRVVRRHNQESWCNTFVSWMQARTTRQPGKLMASTTVGPHVCNAHRLQLCRPCLPPADPLQLQWFKLRP